MFLIQQQFIAIKYGKIRFLQFKKSSGLSHNNNLNSIHIDHIDFHLCYVEC